jgi:hypothetical protein
VGAVSGCGDGTDRELAPDAIAPSGDETVEEIGEERGDEATDGSHGGPGWGQFAKCGEDGAGADDYLGMGRERLTDDENGAGSAGRVGWLGMRFEEVGEGGIAGGSEAQAVVLIAAD